MNWDPAFIQACSFLAVSGAVFCVARTFWLEDKQIDLRLEELSNAPSLVAKSSRKSSVSARVVQLTLPRLAAGLLPNDERESVKLQARLMHAGIYSPWALGAFLVVKIFLMASPPLVGFVMGQFGIVDSQRALLLGAIGGGIGMVLPGLWLDRRKASRHTVLSRSLPDFLDLMVTCVESGLSLEAALQRVTDELQVAHPVLAGEMAVVQRQIEFGTPPDEALQEFADRADMDALFSLSTLIQQARRFGTSVGDALRTQAESLRYAREQRAEELAQQAAVKILFPTMLFIFPAIFVVLAGPAAIQLSEKFSSQEQSTNRID